MTTAQRLDAHRARRMISHRVAHADAMSTDLDIRREIARRAHERHMATPIDMDEERATCTAIDLAMSAGGYAQAVAGAVYLAVQIDGAQHILCIS